MVINARIRPRPQWHAYIIPDMLAPFMRWSCAYKLRRLNMPLNAGGRVPSRLLSLTTLRQAQPGCTERESRPVGGQSHLAASQHRDRHPSGAWQGGAYRFVRRVSWPQVNGSCPEKLFSAKFLQHRNEVLKVLRPYFLMDGRRRERSGSRRMWGTKRKRRRGGSLQRVQVSQRRNLIRNRASKIKTLQIPAATPEAIRPRKGFACGLRR